MSIYPEYDWIYQRSDLKFCPRCGTEFFLTEDVVPGAPQLVCHNCRFIFSLAPNLVVMAVVTYGEAVLLLKRAEEPGRGKWALLAGYVDRWEAPAAALKREAMEETGLEIAVGPVLKVNSFPNAAMVQIIYEATAVTNQIILNEESQDAQFFPRSALPWEEMAFESTKQTLKQFVC